jgi:hypothetical protein
MSGYGGLAWNVLLLEVVAERKRERRERELLWD